jgi:hypothetical protein
MSGVFPIKREYIIYAYIFGLMLLFAGLVLSRALLSSAQAFLGLVWLIDGNHLEKIKSWFKNKSLLLFLVLFAIHLVGMLCTTDIHYGLKELRVKLPLFVIPMIFSSLPPLSSLQKRFLLGVFTFFLIVSSIISLRIFIQINPNDPRELSPIISHIRLSLMLCLAVFFSLHQALQTYKRRSPILLIWVLIAIWLSLYLFMLEALSGLILYFGIGISSLIYLITKTSKLKIRLIISASILLIFLIIGFSVRFALNELEPDYTKSINQPKKHTSAGSPYFSDTSSILNENGNLIWVNVCDTEMRESWQLVSKIPYDSAGYNGQIVKDVMIRYLASKGLTKDAEGIKQLGQEDIKNIEHGMTNYLYSGGIGLRKKFDQLKWEYWTLQSSNNPAGHSILQRFELWKNSISLIKENPLFGVGTGDIKTEFARSLNDRGSSMAGSKLRSHNQYLAFSIQFGIIGIILITVSIILSIMKSPNRKGYLFVVFITIILLSMLAEDTLESQIGASFFALFYSFFILLKTRKPEEELNE